MTNLGVARFKFGSNNHNLYNLTKGKKIINKRLIRYKIISESSDVRSPGNSKGRIEVKL
jgi:hypothetical protein